MKPPRRTRRSIIPMLRNEIDIVSRLIKHGTDSKRISLTHLHGNHVSGVPEPPNDIESGIDEKENSSSFTMREK